KYPATNLPYGPPFFAVLFAAAFSIFGISFPTARLIIIMYTACAALMCWYLIYKLEKNYWVAALAVSALLFNPLTGIYSRDITPELAVAFYSFLTMYLFYNYVEYEKKYFGIYATLAFSLGYLTKPYIIPLGIALSLYIIIRRKWDILVKRETTISILILFVLIVPYTMLAFKYAHNELGPRIKPPVDLNIILAYPKIAISNLPILSLGAIVGFTIGIAKRNKLTLLCLLWVICCYVLFTFPLRIVQDEKYFFSFVPALVLPFAITSYTIILALRKIHLDKAVIAALIFFFLHSCLTAPFYYIRGYEKGGEYIAQNHRGRSVLYYGNYDGSFMMGIRRYKPKDGPFVLRGDRQLAIRVSYGNAKQSVVVKSPQDIMDLLSKYRAGHVVVERNMPIPKAYRDYREYLILKETLKDGDYFYEVARFPIETNYSYLGNELVIYRFNFHDDLNKAELLEIPVPTLKKDLKVSF
ncbi:MAG: ArnT family glycosyltransferase, partial [Candidatus Hodarchaeota archaeon]